MLNIDEYHKERERLLEIFKNIDPDKAELVSGLIDDVAFLKAQNTALKTSLIETGMVKIHPVHKGIQKPIETARQYRQNVNSYAVLIKTLNGVLQKDVLEEEDALDQFIRERKEAL